MDPLKCMPYQVEQIGNIVYEEWADVPHLCDQLSKVADPFYYRIQARL